MRISSAVSILLLLASASAQNGEDACENQGFNQAQCSEVGCCQWDDGECWSAVGTSTCEGGGGGGGGGSGSGPLLEDLTGWANGDVVWHDPPSGWGSCGKVTTVFGVPICVSTSAWAASPSKANHVAHVFYQLLDNDADGVPDDSSLHSHMVSKGYLLWVPSNESDSTNDGTWPSSVGQTQMTAIDETFPNSCDVPANRGASATDRSTWGAAVGNTSGCDTGRDASTEEILHLMTHAASELYPVLWGPSFSSTVGAALSAANGNCGWGYLNNYIDPSSNNCQGQFAYDDTTCDEECNVVEGIYWASVAYIGGLYTTTTTNFAKNEWLMATPDANMPVYPGGVSNAVSLETGSPALYALVSDTTSPGHAWLPAIMPDGRYQGNPGGPPGPPPPTPSPPAPTPSPPAPPTPSPPAPTPSPPAPPTPSPPAPTPSPPAPPTPSPPAPTPSPPAPPTPSPPGDDDDDDDDGLNGEEACENKGFSQNECAAVGCCQWDDGECWSAVGTDTCEGSGPGDDDDDDDDDDNDDDDDYEVCNDQCSDQATPWMIKNGHECNSWIGLGRKCNLKNKWANKKFCQSSCAAIGLGYEGDNCCVDDDENEDDDDLCVECSDNETPWMENNGRDCASSDWLLSRKCNQNNFWTKKSFCQKSCYDKGLGYEGVTCCSGESESSGSAFCWKFGSSCSDSSQCCSGECMGNRRCA